MHHSHKGPQYEVSGEHTHVTMRVGWNEWCVLYSHIPEHLLEHRHALLYHPVFLHQRLISIITIHKASTYTHTFGQSSPLMLLQTGIKTKCSRHGFPGNSDHPQARLSLPLCPRPLPASPPPPPLLLLLLFFHLLPPAPPPPASPAVS